MHVRLANALLRQFVLVATLALSALGTSPAIAEKFDEYSGMTANSSPQFLAFYNKNNISLLFVTERAGRVAFFAVGPPTTGFLAETSLAPNSEPEGIVYSGNFVWLTEFGANAIADFEPFVRGVTEYSAGLSPTAYPYGIAEGSDGAVWFTEFGKDKIGRIDAAGSISEFSAGITAGAGPYSIASDGTNLWFTERAGNRIGKLDIGTGRITEYSAGLTAKPSLAGIALGPDNAMWFVESIGKIGRIDLTTNAITEYSGGISPGSAPSFITSASGMLFFSESIGDRIGQIDPTTGRITEYSNGITAGSWPYGIAKGPDGAIWFVESQTGKVGRLSGILQALAFASTPPTPAIVGQTPYKPIAASSAGLPVTMTIDATASSVCSISGGMVSFLAVGTCLIDANQPGVSPLFDPALQAQQSITVSR